MADEGEFMRGEVMTSMHIAFVAAVFPPEKEPSAVMAGELTQALVQAGHRVTVICPFPNRPLGVIHPGFRKAWKTVTREKGVSVVRVWTWFIDQQRSHLTRLLENLTLGISSALALLVLKKPHILILEAWPILAQLPIVMIGRLRGVRIVNYVKDLYPEALTAAGLISENSLLHALLLKVDSFICRFSSCSVFISDSVRDHVVKTRGLPDAKAHVIRDWLDLEAIRPHSGPSRWREEVSVPSRDVLFMFAGTMGYASGVNVLTEVASLLERVNDMHIVCIGEGPLKDGMVRDKEARHLNNLTILPFQPRSRVSEVQSCADVMLMLTSQNMGVSSVPSKLITYLAVGKPVLCAAEENSDAARIIRENNLGIVVEPGNAQAIADGMTHLYSLGRPSLSTMGVRARAYAMAHYSMHTAIQEFDNLLKVQVSPDLRTHAA